MNRFIRFWGGLLLASALGVGMVALPAGAATKNAPPVSHSTSAPSFASEVASLQGQTVALSDGVTCTVSGAICTTALGIALTLAPVGAREARCSWFCVTSLVTGVLALVSAAPVAVPLGIIAVGTGAYCSHFRWGC